VKSNLTRNKSSKNAGTVLTDADLFVVQITLIFPLLYKITFCYSLARSLGGIFCRAAELTNAGAVRTLVRISVVACIWITPRLAAQQRANRAVLRAVWHTHTHAYL